MTAAHATFFGEHAWTNWHLTVKDLPIAGRFELHNGDGDATVAGMAASAAAVQQVIAQAFAERRRLRAQGAAWSFSEAPAIAGGYVFATGHANWLFPLPPTHVDPGFDGDRDGLLLCQTGVSIAELNMYLEARGRSLATTGASNGQTVVGAMSTSTHGSAVDQPAFQGQIAAIQLLPSPDRNLWIEPERCHVTDGRLAAGLDATVVRSDRLFDAVLVGLGAFGIIHSVLVRTVPRFLMLMNRQRLTLSNIVRRAMVGDLDGSGLPGSGQRPYFFQSVVNDHIDKGAAYVTVGHKLPWQDTHKLNYALAEKSGPGFNAAIIVAKLVQAFPGVTPRITKAVLADQLKPIKDRKASWGESFNFTTPRAGAAGSSIAVPADRTFDALAALQRAYDEAGPAPVAFACRYAVRSPGLLAFPRYPRTALIDIDGIDTPATRAVMAKAVANVAAAGIPHAEHWGKLNQLSATSVRDAYGDDLETWVRVRTDLLDARGEYVFGSQFLDRLGMTSPRP